MEICLDLEFVQKIKSQDLLTYLALVLAYLAYVWSINRDLNAWQSLFISFKEELNLFGNWLGGEGYGSSSEYRDKNSYSPYNIIFPLSFVALPEIIRKGPKEFNWIRKEFSEQLSVFNNRVAAFNSVLDRIKHVCSANPVLSEQLYNKLRKLGLKERDEDLSFENFIQQIKEMQNKENELEMAFLADSIRRLNVILHTSLISDKSRSDMLHSGLISIQNEIDLIITKFDDHRPWFVRWQIPIILASLGIFLLIELTLN